MLIFKAFLRRVKADGNKMPAKYQVQGVQVFLGSLYLEGR